MLGVALSGQRGPVFVEVPRDLLSHPTQFTSQVPEQYRPLAAAGSDPAIVERAVALLATARKPVIIAGSGLKWSRGSHALIELIEALNVPLITSNANRDWCRTITHYSSDN